MEAAAAAATRAAAVAAMRSTKQPTGGVRAGSTNHLSIELLNLHVLLIGGAKVIEVGHVGASYDWEEGRYRQDRCSCASTMVVGGTRNRADGEFAVHKAATRNAKNRELQAG